MILNTNNLHTLICFLIPIVFRQLCGFVVIFRWLSFILIHRSHSYRWAAVVPRSNWSILTIEPWVSFAQDQVMHCISLSVGLSACLYVHRTASHGVRKKMDAQHGRWRNGWRKSLMTTTEESVTLKLLSIILYSGGDPKMTPTTDQIEFGNNENDGLTPYTLDAIPGYSIFGGGRCLIHWKRMRMWGYRMLSWRPT